MKAKREVKIQTLHPRKGTKGWNISRQKYEVVRSAINKCLRDGEQLTHVQLETCATEGVGRKFEGSIPWYYEVVKLDLEAKRVIKRLSEKKPELYRLLK